MPIEQAIAAFFELYTSAFSRCDVNKISELWTFPAFITGESRSAVFDNAQSFEKNTTALCDFYKRQGMKRAHKTVLSAQALYPGVVLARTKDELFDEADELITQWEHTYLLRNTDDGWRALAAVADDEMQAWASRGTPLSSPSQ